MADPRVHPTAVDPPPPLFSSSSSQTADQSEPPAKSSDDQTKQPQAQPTTYVVQLPREQIFRYPPPENAKKFEALSRGKNGRGCCRRCCCCTFCILLIVIIAAAISAGVLYLVFRFKSPEYSVVDLDVRGIDLTSPSSISPGFDVTIRANNPNGKMGIYYLKDSSVSVFYEDVKLSDGALPDFYQPKKNTTLIQTTLTGSDVVLAGAVKSALRNAQNRGRVPFLVRIKAPVKLKVGAVKTWTITVKVKCDVVTDALDEGAEVVSTKCDYSVRLW